MSLSFIVARIGVLVLTVAAGGAALSRPWSAASVVDDRSAASSPNRPRIWMLRTAAAGGVTALAVLGWAFLTEDWRFATVVGHARPDVPWTLRLAAIWAGPEGSLLLWTTMLAGAALVAARLEPSSRPGRILAATTAGYGLVVATVADPFERLAAPPGAGNGLQPVLEHPAMLWHPPVLYLGLIAMLVPAVSSVGDRVNRRSGGSVAWTLPLALALLTAGLATGANWAHVELGWGGYWAWDPIENAGLVAWLAGASLLHRLPRPPEPGEGPVPGRSLAVVAVIPGIAAVWATTITRTGVLNSVHAFANRPTLRLMLLIIAGVFTAVVGGLALLGGRRHRGPSTPGSALRSTAGFAAIGLATVVVAVGTYEPALEMLARDDAFTISGRFYSLLLWPIAVIGAVFRVRATLRTAASAVPPRSVPVLVAAAAGAVGAMVVVTADTGATGLILAAAGGAVVGSTLADRTVGDRTVGDRTAGDGPSSTGRSSRLAHLGMGVLLVGIAGTTATTSATVVALTDAEAVTPIGVVTHRGVELVERDGTSRAVASVELTEGRRTRTFHPELVSYLATGGESAEVDTDRGWAADVQVVLVDADADRATYRISRHPRLSLVWLGAAVTTVGLSGTAAARRRRTRLRTEVEPALS